jgi:hypothetical protein
MTECTNELLRDELPALAQGLLRPAEAARVQAHVAACASCAQELAVLRAAATVFAAATPTIDTSAILAKLPTPASRPALRVVRGAAPARGLWGLPRYALAAAASLTLVATLSLTVLRPVFFGAGPGVVTPAGVGSDVPDSVPGGTAVAVMPTALVGGTELSDLGMDELSMLLEELEAMEATIAAEPVSWREPVADLPGGV